MTIEPPTLEETLSAMRRLMAALREIKPPPSLADLPSSREYAAKPDLAMRRDAPIRDYRLRMIAKVACGPGGEAWASGDKKVHRVSHDCGIIYRQIEEIDKDLARLEARAPMRSSMIGNLPSSQNMKPPSYLP
jgi:hypothetical protein